MASQMYVESRNKIKVRRMVWDTLANVREKTAYALCGPDPLKVVQTACTSGFEQLAMFERDVALAVSAQSQVNLEDLGGMVQVLQGDIAAMAGFADLQKVGAFDFDFCGQPINATLNLVHKISRRHAVSPWPMINIGVSTKRVNNKTYSEFFETSPNNSSSVGVLANTMCALNPKLRKAAANAISKICVHMNNLELATSPKRGFELVHSFVYWTGAQWMVQVVLRRTHRKFLFKKPFWFSPVTVLE